MAASLPGLDAVRRSCRRPPRVRHRRRSPDAFVFGWPSIIAVIINYVTRDRVRGTWLETHWRWQLRSFWFAALWLLVAGLLMITLIGIPAAILVVVSTGLWVLYRVIRGWMALLDRRPMPVPAA